MQRITIVKETMRSSSRRKGTRYRRSWAFDVVLFCLPLLLLTAWAEGRKQVTASLPSAQEAERAPALAQEKSESVSQPSFETYTPKERGWWAYQKPQRPQLPIVKNPSWVKTPVDLFVLARLEKAGLTPAAPADRATLLRRVTFDLIGLPPTPEEIDAFVNDSSPKAYAKVVENLLASPRYGERWGRHWLDVVRYADTDGFEYDTLRPHTWRYRDYVIKSFNEDKSYNRFILEQLAGDELAPSEPDALVAVGFNRLAALRKNAGNQDEDMNRNEVLTERTNAVGAVFLGSTLACARCHNHLFDPLRQSDYYHLQAFFAPSVPKEIPLATPEVQDVWESKAKVVKDEIEQVKKSFGEMEKQWNLELRQAKLQRLSAEEKKVLDIPVEQRTLEQRNLASIAEKKLASKGDELARRYLAEVKAKKKEMMQTLETLEAKMPEPLPAIWSLTDDCQQIPEIHVLERGDHSHKGKRVGPRIPGVFLPENAPEVKDRRGPTTGRRLALAQWIASPENPLTARVMVNRLWHYHFNRGIVATPNDFGAQGAAPTHPDLLDWLATEFVRQQWSIKAMHRLMVLSSTYQLASEGDPGKIPETMRIKDPDNRFFWRYNRRRLEAEEFRDSMLSIAGNLNLRAGGPAVFVPVQPVLTKQLYNPRQWSITADVEEHNRRGVYLVAKRNLQLSFMAAFDSPDMQNSCARREQSTHALQALELLNGDFSNAQATELARRLLREAGPNSDSIVARAFRLATGRLPSSREQELAKQFLVRQTELLRKQALRSDESSLSLNGDLVTETALCDFALTVFNLPGFLYVN